MRNHVAGQPCRAPQQRNTSTQYTQVPPMPKNAQMYRESALCRSLALVQHTQRKGDMYQHVEMPHGYAVAAGIPAEPRKSEVKKTLEH